jgi:hypothetical protein
MRPSWSTWLERASAALICALALAFSFDASAARLTPSTRLSSQATGSGAHSVSSVSIPALTTTAVVTFYFGVGSSNNAPTGVTLDGQSAVKKVSNETAGTMQIAYYAITSGLSTGGSKTLAWTNPVAYSALDIGIEYLDGSNTFGATDTDNCSGCGTLTTNPIANTSGDNILCAYGGNGGTLTGSGAGQTTLDDTSGTSDYGFSTKTGAGGTATLSFTFSAGLDAYVCAAITTAAAGGGTKSSPVGGPTAGRATRGPL